MDKYMRIDRDEIEARVRRANAGEGIDEREMRRRIANVIKATEQSLEESRRSIREADEESG